MLKSTSLDTLTLKELRAVWQSETQSSPPPIASQSFLSKALCYERQLNSLGGLSKRDQNRLRAYDSSPEPKTAKAGKAIKQSIKLTPGSRLIRVWNGKTYTVSVIEEGFVYLDKVWPSLSSIARNITGAHWSGPRFFSTKTERIAP